MKPIEQLIQKKKEAPLRVINVGLISFRDSLQQQQVHNLHVRWSPPAGGNPELIELLKKVSR